MSDVLVLGSAEAGGGVYTQVDIRNGNGCGRLGVEPTVRTSLCSCCEVEDVSCQYSTVDGDPRIQPSTQASGVPRTVEQTLYIIHCALRSG